MGLGDFLRRFFGGKPRSQPDRAPSKGPAPSQSPAPTTNWPGLGDTAPKVPYRPPLSRPAPPPMQSNWPAPGAPVQNVPDNRPAPPPPVPIPSLAPVAPRQEYRPPERRDKTLALDAAQFRPLPADQIRSQAMSTQFSGFFEFGRRDRIPSPIDPRTKLIDQAMVGQGLIKPEELVRIHELGLKMDELRPELVGAHTIAQQAIQADKEAKARIKAEKKAAAEQRKKDHAARVAANKQSDIIHLGRGVSKGLADRRSNIEKLQQQNLPILSTPSDLANALGIKIPKLRWLAYHAEASTVTHYIQFIVPKKSGGERMLSAPHQQLAAVQQWIFDQILAKLSAHDAAHGFVKSRSIVTNARPHIGAAVVINCDLTDFFPSITVHRVIGFFKHIGYSPAVATILALLVTDSPRRKVLYKNKPWYVATAPRGLPQGACTSPPLSNLIARRLDSRLSGIAKKLEFTYTRYADDLTFSSKTKSDRIGYLLARIRHIASDEGFAVNEKKTRVLKQAARQNVTGVVVNVHPASSRSTRRRLRAILHNASKTGMDTQNRTRRKGFAAWLGGMISFVGMVNPKHAIGLREKLKALRG
jgi:RNA-directed DNA polymerase